MVKVAVVTGANKGLGFAIVKGLLKKFNGKVYLTSRDEGRGKAAVAELNQLDLKPEYHQLDITDRESITRFRSHIKETYGSIDILINNAAIANRDFEPCSYEEAKNIMNTVYYSMLIIEELLFPLVNNNGRILNISSNCGHLSNIRNEYWIQRLSKKDLNVSDIHEFVNWFLKGIKNYTFNYDDLADGGTVAAYRIAKVALTAKTMLQQKDLESRNISINSVHPGLVKTDMTYGQGFFDIDQAAETPIYLVLEAPESLKGAYVWYDKKVVDWYDYKSDHYFTANSLQV